MLGDKRWEAMARTGAVDPEGVLQNVLPILEAALAMPAIQRAWPAIARCRPVDWISYVNRAGVLMELDDFAGAEAANNAALKLRAQRTRPCSTTLATSWPRPVAPNRA